jgi:hypothetical protein
MEKDFAGPLNSLESAAWSLESRQIKLHWSYGRERGALIQGREHDPLNHTKKLEQNRPFRVVSC